MVFFFSSRRRHTRCSRDWSSDVCSSDLYATAIETFIFLLRKLGVREGPGQPGPRLHDLRHTFASRALENRDRKSTRLNSSHGYISYAVFCLKKKNNLILYHCRHTSHDEP